MSKGFDWYGDNEDIVFPSVMIIPAEILSRLIDALKAQVES